MATFGAKALRHPGIIKFLGDDVDCSSFSDVTARQDAVLLRTHGPSRRSGLFFFLMI